MRIPLALAFSVLIAKTALPADAIRIPDAKTGEINGVVAVMFWPATSTHTRGVDELLPADHCHAVLEPWTNLAAELTFDCGIWFQPPEGRYRVWLERGDSLTPTTGSLNYAAAPFTGRGNGVIMPVEPGGRVALAADVSMPPNSELRLINFDSCCTASRFTHPFDRRALPTSRGLRNGLLMPPGRVLAGVFNRATNEAIALAPPAQVVAGKLTFVSPHAPANGTDVFVSLMRPDIRHSRDIDPIRLTLGGRAPQTLFDGSDRVYAVWYGVEGKSARLVVESKTLQLAARDLKLAPGHVVTVRDELRRLPSIAVSLLAPPGALADREAVVDVRQPSRVEPMRSTSIAPGEETRLAALPLEPLDVMLTIGPWQFRRHVDLTRGLDEQVVFDLHPIIVKGTVFYGRDPSPHAGVGFETGHGWERTKADENGHYEVTLWSPNDAYLAEVNVASREGPPFEEGFVQIRDSRTLDFHVPATRYDVRVVDAASGAAIAAATVSAANVWKHESGEEATIVQRAITNEDGVAALAPLRRGKLSLRARASGYFDSAAVDGGSIETDDASGTIEVQLRAVGETSRVHLRSTTGQPIAGAEVWAVAATTGTRPPLWRGTSDSEGVVAVPRSVDGSTLLIRSRNTASAVRSFRATAREEEIMMNAAAPPLRISIGTPDTRIAIWVDGLRITGPAVTFLTWSSEVSDSAGFWSAANLPPQPMRLLAWRRVRETEIVTGMRDVSAETIAYPWPAVVRVTPLD